MIKNKQVGVVNSEKRIDQPGNSMNPKFAAAHYPKQSVQSIQKSNLLPGAKPNNQFSSNQSPLKQKQSLPDNIGQSQDASQSFDVAPQRKRMSGSQFTTSQLASRRKFTDQNKGQNDFSVQTNQTKEFDSSKQVISKQTSK